MRMAIPTRIGEEQQTKGPLGGAHFRTGVVDATDYGDAPTTGRLRVRFPDRNLLSWPLFVVFAKTQNDKFFHLPDVGEQVACFLDAHDEDGCILGAIYSTADTPPPGMTPNKDHVSYSDGAVLEYDRETHAAKISLPAGSSLKATLGDNITVDLEQGPGTAEIDAPTITLKSAGGQLVLDASGAFLTGGTGMLGLMALGAALMGAIVNLNMGTLGVARETDPVADGVISAPASTTVFAG